MPVLTRVVPDDEIGQARRPRDDVVVEVSDGPDRFRAAGGPFDQYERRLRTEPDGTVSEHIDYRLAPMVWPIPFAPLYRKALLAPGLHPWWSPPESPAPHAASSWLVGSGPGAGIALLFVFTGIGASLVGLIGYLFPAIRNAEEILPDHDEMEMVPAGV
jgi:hypothetical protein